MNELLFDERQADKEVIESLLKTNRSLWRELEASRSMIKSLEEQFKRSYPMSKLLQDENGVLYFAKEVEVVAVEQAQKLVSHLQSDLTLVQNFLVNVANGQTDASSQGVPADTTGQVAPADPNQPPAENPNAQAAPVNQTVPAADPNANPAPTDTTVNPASVEQPAPAVDANGNPVQTPAQDPNQVQPQPEQTAMPPLQ